MEGRRERGREGRGHERELERVGEEGKGKGREGEVKKCERRQGECVVGISSYFRHCSYDVNPANVDVRIFV